jgi:hypothetical protein
MYKYDYDCVPCSAATPKASAAAGVTIVGSPAPMSDAEMQRLYLGQRLRDAFLGKMDDLRTKFKIDFFWRPKTAQEAKARLDAGLFTIKDADKKDPVRYTYLDNVFSWRGPDDQADVDGYDAARADLEKVYSATLDKIRIADPKDGLVILEAFKAA